MIAINRRSGLFLACALLVVLMPVGFVAVNAYPRLEVEGITLTPALSPVLRPNLTAVIELQLNGQGTFQADHVSVSLGDVSAVAAGTLQYNVILRGVSVDLVVVAEFNYFGAHVTTLAVTVDGIWTSPVGLAVPVSVSATSAVGQSAWQA